MRELLATVRQEDPGPVLWIVMPDAYWPVVQVNQRRGEVTYAISLDPVSGQILGTRNESTALMPIIYQLHQNLLLRRFWGEELVGIAGLALALSCLSGLWLWWPKPSRFWKSVTLRRGQNTYRTAWDAHNAVGFWSSLILLLVALSGAAMIFHNLAKAVVRPLGMRELKTPVLASGYKGVADPDAVLAAALRARPTDHPTYVVLPTSDTEPWYVAMRPANYHGRSGSMTTVYVDPNSYAVMQIRSPETWKLGDWLLDHQFSLHNGSLAGDLGRFLVFLSGIAFPVLGWSGAYVWWHKRKMAARAGKGRRA